MTEKAGKKAIWLTPTSMILWLKSPLRQGDPSFTYRFRKSLQPQIFTCLFVKKNFDGKSPFSHKIAESWFTPPKPQTARPI